MHFIKLFKLLNFLPFSAKFSSKSTISPKNIHQSNPRFKMNAVIQFSRYENQNQKYRIKCQKILNTITKTRFSYFSLFFANIYYVSHGVILWKTSLIINWANIVTASLSVPKLHNSFENLKGLYYFDMIRQGVLHLCTLYTTLLEPKLPNLTWKIWIISLYNYTICFSTFDWPDIELEKQEVNVQPR